MVAVWVWRHAVVASRKALVRKRSYKRLDQFWRNAREQFDFISSGSCGCSAEVIPKKEKKTLMIDEKGYQEREYKRKRSEEFCRSMYACSPSPPFLLSPAHELFLDRVC